MANIPVEVAETDWPILIERYGLVPDSGGAGRYRGGLAIERVWRVLAPDTAVHVRSDRQVHRPYGLAGGGEGAAVLEPDRPRGRHGRADAADVRRHAAAGRRLPPPDAGRRRARRPARARPGGGRARRAGREGLRRGGAGAVRADDRLRDSSRPPAATACASSSASSRRSRRRGVLGPAFTVQGAGADNLALHHAVAEAAPGDVIVLAVGGERDVAHCGEIIAVAARTRGVAGIVARRRDPRPDRDRRARAAGLPPRHLAARPGQERPRERSASRSSFAGTRVEPGDLVCADADGVAIVPAPIADEVRAAAEALDRAGAGDPRRDRARRDDRRHLRLKELRMRITAVEATPLAIPLAQEFHWAGGAQVGANLVLFTVHTDEGVSGYGESVCEDPQAVVSYGQLMARQLIGRSPGDMEGILRSIWTRGTLEDVPAVHPAHVRRASRSPAGTRSAARSACRPRTFFGGRVQDELDYFGFLQGDDPDALARARARARGRGIRGDLPQGRARRRARRRVRRRRARGDRARPAAPDRPERGLGLGDRGRPDPPARALRPRLGRAADARRRRQRPRARPPLGRA